jgi:hypothetical protein
MPGGTLVLHAHGRIEVSGVVTAEGEQGLGGGGSGGSILLRGDGGVTVLPGGMVTAQGGWNYSMPPATYGSYGYVRLDAWAQAPIVQGAVVPTPTIVTLPHLRTQSPPRIGTTWLLDVLAPENAPAFLAASFYPGRGRWTPFGSLDLDLGAAVGIAVVVPQPGHDPIATVPWPIPNDASLVGLSLFVQGFVFPQLQPPRLTNSLGVVIG